MLCGSSRQLHRDPRATPDGRRTPVAAAAVFVLVQLMRRRLVRKPAVWVPLTVILIIAAAFAWKNPSSSQPVSGRWGRLITCLESHPLLSVRPASGVGGVGPHTHAVAVLQQLSGALEAYVENVAMAGGGSSRYGSARIDHRVGSVRYGYASAADGGDVLLVKTCLTSMYG